MSKVVMFFLKKIILISFLLFICLSSLFSSRYFDDPEKLFLYYNLEPTYISSYFTVLPDTFDVKTTEFSKYKNNLLFSIIKYMSKGLTLDIEKYKNKEVEIKFYSIVDKLKKELFPYTNDYDNMGIAVIFDKKIIGILLINQYYIISVDGSKIIRYDIPNEKIEEILEIVKTKKIESKDLYLKKLKIDDFLKDLVKDISEKNIDNVYSYFSYEYRFKLLFGNFLKEYFQYNEKNLFFGNINNVKELKSYEIKPIVYQPEFNKKQLFELNLKLLEEKEGKLEETEKNFLVIFSYSKTFGYRISDIQTNNKKEIKKEDKKALDTANKSNKKVKK